RLSVDESAFQRRRERLERPAQLLGRLAEVLELLGKTLLHRGGRRPERDARTVAPLDLRPRARDTQNAGVLAETLYAQADVGQAETGHDEVDQLLAGRLQGPSPGLNSRIDALPGRPVADPWPEADQLGRGLHAVQAGQRMDGAFGHRPVA